MDHARAEAEEAKAEADDQAVEMLESRSIGQRPRWAKAARRRKTGGR